MKLKTVGYISLISAAAIMTSAANADDHRKGKGKRGMHGAQIERMFNDADANSDNVLTRDELRAGVAVKFAAIDTDGNGQITREEMKVERDAQRAARFAAMDTDGNGTLSAGEMAARMQDRVAQRVQSRMERLDTNKDGQISQEELNAQMGERGGRGDGERGMRDGRGDGEHGKRDGRGDGERGMRDGRGEGKHGKRGGHRGGEHGKRGGRGMRGDRTITLAGMEARALRMFDRLDADRDGYVTKFELSQAAAHRGKR